MPGKRARPVRVGGRRKRTCTRRHLADGLPTPCVDEEFGPVCVKFSGYFPYTGR